VLWHSLVAVTWAIWWGGLTFYAGVVVPVGARIVGINTQGQITQEVTRWLNGVGFVGLVALLAEACRIRRRSAIVVAVLAVICQAALFAIHSWLSKMLAAGVDPAGFYQVHRIYLWITAIQWLSGLAVVWLVIWPERR